MIVLAAALVAVHMVFLLQYVYDAGYDQGWMDHSAGQTTYTARTFVESLERRR